VIGLRRRPPAEIPDSRDLGVDWARWADGRAWRLKRKRDFPDVNPGRARDAAEYAADRMGKGVQTTRDQHFPTKYVWVQFADHIVKPGNPCPCGSQRILRVHTHFGRCPECKAQILLRSSSDDDDESRPVARLSALTDVHLQRFDRDQEHDRDVYRGYGQKAGAAVLVVAEFHVEDGEELTPAEAFDRVQKVKVFSLEQFEGLVDASSLLKRSPRDWDLVL
jgi:hypothetical protein